MAITAAMMIAAASSVRRVIGSDRSQRAERDRHHGIDVRVGGNRADRRVVEEPDVRAEADERADDDEVDERQQARGGERRRVGPAGLAGQDADEHERDAAGEHLHPGRDPRAARQRRAALVERACGPADRGEHDEPDARRVDLGRAARRGDEDDDADEPGHDATEQQRARPAPREERLEQVEPDRHRRDQDRRDPGREQARLLGEHDEAVAAEEQQDTDDRRRAPVDPGGAFAFVGPPAEPAVDPERREQDEAGDRVADAGRPEGRQRVDDVRDAEVRAPPHEIDRQQRDDGRDDGGLLARWCGHRCHCEGWNAATPDAVRRVRAAGRNARTPFVG